MSMLSDKKRKAKWSLNPRGHLWTQDESKFGQKMLEKLGWEKGKGLGAKKQGITEIISLKSIDENQGLGFKGDKDEWIAHQDDFTSVLAGLSEHHSNELEETEVPNKEDGKKTDDTQSLEYKSKNTKKRIHYHKFTRSKDTSSYSSSDLNSILGSEVVAKKKKQKVEEDKEAQLKNNEEAKVEKCDNGLLVIKGGSINDYFAKKMAELNKRKGVSRENDNSIEPSSSELIERVKKSSEKDAKPCNIKSTESAKEPSDILNPEMGIADNNEVTITSSLVKKKNKIDPDVDDTLINSGCGGASKKDSSEENVPPVKKSKKKRKKDKKQNSESENVVEEKSTEMEVEGIAHSNSYKNGERFKEKIPSEMEKEVEGIVDSSSKKKGKRKKDNKSSGTPVKKKSKNEDVDFEDNEPPSDSQNSGEKAREDNENNKVPKTDTQSLPEAPKKKKSKKDKSDSVVKEEEVKLKKDDSSSNAHEDPSSSTNKSIKPPPPKEMWKKKGSNKFASKKGKYKHRPNFKAHPNVPRHILENEIALKNKMRKLKSRLISTPIAQLDVRFKGSNIANVKGYGV
uniref:PIN2/TERF1 interacting, telomerase inhibitor 1 [Xenopus laevis] n=1 Tax=Lepeophtheirus salmonis TaxID=72036 RepID=A0A0K2UC25_LEPSM